METQATNRSKFYKNLLLLTVGGGVAFWVFTYPFSLLPIAADFRAALSISYFQVVIVESLIGGMIISGILSYLMLRFFGKIPTKNPILKSVILSTIALIIDLVLISVAAIRTSNALNVVLIGAVLNIPRFLFVGVAIGYLYNEIKKREQRK